MRSPGRIVRNASPLSEKLSPAKPWKEILSHAAVGSTVPPSDSIPMLACSQVELGSCCTAGISEMSTHSPYLIPLAEIRRCSGAMSAEERDHWI